MAQFPTFPDFFRALWGKQSYRWQNEIAEDIANGKIPPTIAAPTAAGKTALIDAWLWALAKNLNEGKIRNVPLRLFFVVDRRLVVDSAFERANNIRDRLIAADSPAEIKAVADVLRRLGGESPLGVARMRGGVEWERTMWCESPARPMVICSTVDQVGSRLLFRGYGVSARQRALQAGLVGGDSLMILDEAHLSSAFSQTLKDCRRFGGGNKAIRPLQVVEMTATPRGGDKKPLDVSLDGIHHLSAPKNISLGGQQSEEEKIAGAMIIAAIAELKGAKIPAPVVAVIVNTVALARSAFDEARKAAQKSGDEIEAILLTGRNRPRARDELVDAYKNRLLAGRDRKAQAKPLLVVATQCIEAGADFDFDFMITEGAPLDVLRQRFGRVDRLGKMADINGADAIRGKIIGERKLKFYGDATKKTREWLDKIAENGVVNFAPNALKEKMDADKCALKDMTAPTATPPFLSPPLLEELERTAERGDSGIIPHLLHGRRDVAEVFLLWRADLPSFARDDAAKEIVRRIGWLRPQSGEILSLPLWAAREWLNGKTAANVADVDGAEAGENGKSKNPQSAPRWAARIRYDDGDIFAEVIKGGGDVRAGDILALPAEPGGCDKFGWNPENNDTVEDVAEEKRVIRLHRRVHSAAAHSAAAEWLDAAAGEDDPESFLQKNAPKIAAEVASGGAGEKINPKDVVVHFYNREEENIAEGVCLILPKKPRDKKTGGRVCLEKHSGKVAAAVVGFAESIGLPALIADLETAAWWHDAGKAERRFQAGFAGSPECPLARNGDLSDREIRQRRKIAGIKPGERHEFWSAALVKNAFDNGVLSAAAESQNLILWLIATHHGNARVLPAPPRERPDNKPGKITVTLNHKTGETDNPNLILDPAFGWAGIWRANRERFGVWGLAFLEALLRLADIQTAKREEEEE